MVFQDPYSSLNPRMTTAARSSASRSGCTGSPGGARSTSESCRLFEQVGLRPELRHRYPHELSGGQRQRVGLARALSVSAVAVDRRRTRLRSRRLGASLDPQPAARPPARPRLLVPVHHPRPRDRRVPLRSRRRDVSRQDRRGDRDRGAVRGAASSVHPGSSLSRRRRRSGCPAGADAGRPRGRRTEPPGAAVRLSLPHALPTGARSPRRSRSRWSRRSRRSPRATASPATWCTAAASRRSSSTSRVSRHDVHHQAGAAGDVRDGRVHALAGHSRRDGRARARGQRVRRGGGDRIHAPGGRAAPQRAGRRSARRLLVGRARRAARALRAGGRARRRDDRSLPAARARARARHRPPGRLRAGGVRRLVAAARRVRHLAARGRPRVRDRLRRRGVSGGARDHADDRAHRGAAAHLGGIGGAVPPRPAPRSALLQPHARGDVPADRRGVTRRVTRAGARACTQPVLRGLRRRGDRPLLRRARRVADRVRPRRLGAHARVAGDARLPRAHGVQDGPVGPGAGLPPAARAARRLRPRRAVGRRVRPRGGRVREARIRRP